MSKDWHQACRGAADLARGAIAWINDVENHKTVGSTRPSIDRRLRTLVTELTKLDRSVDRPMSVSVFGPSQAGKSYLGSVLAGAGERPLMARFAGEAGDVDFLTDINPPGDRESTGVVTRFSLHAVPTPPGYPVCLRLLTEIEIAKILANSYFLDGNPKLLVPTTPQDLSEVLTKARARAAGQSKPADNRLTAEDIWDLQAYCAHTFEGTVQLAALSGFWDEASRLAPHLEIADRAALFALLWGGLPEFTELYRELTEALARIDFATEAYCPMAALIPRSASIIDVLTLAGIGKSTGDRLEIRSFHGAPVALPRPIITALTAELRINITESPWPFFAHTDLLDFPGARSRQPIDLARELRNKDRDQLKESILRGKVAYLFERYVAEQELTSMLLCVKPSNQDVATLPDMINDWIAVSHGATPADRLGKSVVLFLVLTMFDLHFMEKAGEGSADPGERFKSRIFSSIENFFGKAHDWPREWTPGRTFTNTFWLRNPTIKSEFLMRYEGGREAGVRPDKGDYVAALREGYLGIGSVSRYFADPARAFDEALKLNDGGIGYLVEKLTPVCRPGLKDEQIRGRLTALRNELHIMLEPFHVDNDVEKRLEERRAVGGRIIEHVQSVAHQRRFADLVAALQISEEAASRVVYEAQARRGRRDSGEEVPSGEAGKPPSPLVGPAVPIAGRPLPGARPLPGRPSPSVAAAPPPSTHARLDGLDFYLAKAVIEHWIGGLYAAAETEILGRFFVGDPRLALELVNEIAGATRRLRLDERLAQVIVGLAGSVDERNDAFLEKVTFASCLIVNRFVNEFGYGEISLEERPQAPDSHGGTRPILAPRKAADAAAQIDIAPSAHHDDFLYDWMYALYDVIENNARSVEGLSVNIEQNLVLGRILEGLRDDTVSLNGHG